MTTLSLNDALAQEVIRQSVNVVRYGEGQAQTTIRELIRLDKILTGLIAQTAPTAQLRVLLKFAREEINKSLDAVALARLAEQRRLIVSVATETQGALNVYTGAEIASRYTEPSFVKAVAKDINLMGKPAEKYWKAQKRETYNQFSDILRNGFVTGRNTADMTREWLQASSGLKADAATQVRTGVLSAANAARMEVYRQNKEVISGVKAVATLDLRTSEICRARDGMVWYFDGNGDPVRPRNASPTQTLPDTWYRGTTEDWDVAGHWLSESAEYAKKQGGILKKYKVNPNTIYSFAENKKLQDEYINYAAGLTGQDPSSAAFADLREELFNTDSGNPLGDTGELEYITGFLSKHYPTWTGVLFEEYDTEARTLYMRNTHRDAKEFK